MIPAIKQTKREDKQQKLKKNGIKLRPYLKPDSKVKIPSDKN